MVVPLVAQGGSPLSLFIVSIVLQIEMASLIQILTCTSVPLPVSLQSPRH